MFKKSTALKPTASKSTASKSTTSKNMSWTPTAPKPTASGKSNDTKSSKPSQGVSTTGSAYTSHGSGSGSKKTSSSSGSHSKPQGDKSKSSSTKTHSSKGSSSGGSSGGSPSGGGKKHSSKQDPKDQTEEPPQYQRLYVTVFKGFPTDSTKKRHCGLLIEYIEYVNNQPHIVGRNMADIKGFAGNWRPHVSTNRNPDGSGLLAAQIFVKEFYAGQGQEGRNNRRLLNDISSTRIRNEPEYADWNCQSWLGDALARLVVSGWLTEDERFYAIDQAMGVVAEATS